MENQGPVCRFPSFEIGNTDRFSHGFRTLVSNSSTANTLDDQIKQKGIENSDSETLYDQESSISDCESGISGTNSEQFKLFNNNLIRLDEEDTVHELIKKRFDSGLGSLVAHTKIVAIHRNVYSSAMGQARAQSFQIYMKAMENKCAGNANVKYAWYATSKDDICKIFLHGFGHCGKPQNNGLYGCGVYLSPNDSPIESVKSTAVDEDGLRHLLLCRVILGKPELVHPGSEQSHPSSQEFDLGVDNLVAPKKYIVWSTHMNTHILPEYVISFRAPSCLKGFIRIQEPLRRPTSPWMPFPALISVLSKFLPPPAISLLNHYHKDHRERTISRHDLIQKVRHIAGDKLLIEVIKSFRAKQLKLPAGFRQKMARNSARNGGENIRSTGSKDLFPEF